MTAEQALAAIRARAATDHPACVRALNLLLDDKTAGMSAHIAMHTGPDATERHAGFMAAYRTAAQHIKEALFEAFDIWPDTTGDPS